MTSLLFANSFVLCGSIETECGWIMCSDFHCIGRTVKPILLYSTDLCCASFFFTAHTNTLTHTTRPRTRMKEFPLTVSLLRGLCFSCFMIAIFSYSVCCFWICCGHLSFSSVHLHDIRAETTFFLFIIEIMFNCKIVQVISLFLLSPAFVSQFFNRKNG